MRLAKSGLVPVKRPQRVFGDSRHTMRNLTVKCFGVGDGAACADRNHSSFLYDFGDASLLIDCGEPLSRSYKASGLSYEKVDRLLLSHLHFDHLGGFFMFLQGVWLEKRLKKLPVHLPANGIEPVRRLLNAACLFDELLSFPLEYQALRNGQPIRQESVVITPFLTSHLDGFKKSFEAKYPGNFESYCFLLEGHGLRAGHSADIGRPEDLDPLLERPLDLLVVELAHYKPETLFAYLQGHAIRKIVFTHVGRAYWEDLPALRKLAATMLPDRDFIFVHDLDEIVVSAQ